MDLISEVFPNYNPLPNLVSTFRILEGTNEIADPEVVQEIIDQIFSEAGVIIETLEDMRDLIQLLVVNNVLMFVKRNDETLLVSNPQYHIEE